MSWLALDIGGANLKAADGCGYAASRRFPLWQRPEALAEELTALIAESPVARRLAVTMTGELADCFQTKAEGVAAILKATEAAADHREVFVYLCDGEFVRPQFARERTLLAAASNWHALASFAVRHAADCSALLMDVGSTTTDLIPIGVDGPRAIGITDPERLASRELVYTGVRRSPVCALVQHLPWRGETCGVAQELFATTADAYLVLGELAEDPQDMHTADGRPFTKENAQARLARCICADSSMFSWEDAQRVAAAIEDAQLELLKEAAQQIIARLEGTLQTLVISGEGEFLARDLVQRLGISCNIVSLTETLGPTVSQCAPAHAVAVLAREVLGE